MTRTRMQLVNLFLKGAYLLLQWYFTSDMVKGFLQELNDYLEKNKTTKTVSESPEKNTDKPLENT